MFKAKIRKIGNSLGVIIPADVITGYGLNDFITLNVITKDDNVITKDSNVITTKEQASEAVKAIVKSKTDKKRYNNPFSICPKHNIFFNSCGCK